MSVDFELKDVRVVISIMVMCSDIVITKCDRKRLGLPNEPVYMEYGNKVLQRYS